MGQQKPLFYDDWRDALRTAIRDSGKPWKEVALHLWPDMKMDSAYARLKSCLGESGDQKLDFGQAIALMRFCGQYDALYHACDELDHDRPAIRAPQDEMAELMRDYIRAAESMKRTAERIERVQMRAVS